MRRLAATAVAAPLLGIALLTAGATAATAATIVPDPPTPAVEVASVTTDPDVAGQCLVTFSWNAVGGMVDHFAYAVSDTSAVPAQADETSTTANTVEVSVAQGAGAWISVTAETRTGARSGTSQAGTDHTTC